MKTVILAIALGSASAEVSHCSNKHKPLFKDMARAHRRTQSSRLGGESSEEIAAKINSAVSAFGAPVKPCEAFSSEELNQIVRDMHCHFNEHLDDVLSETDSRRRRFRDLEAFEQAWDEERRILADAANDSHSVSEAEEMLRDGKCAEVLMLFAHHLPTSAKESLVHEFGLTLPVMNPFDEKRASSPDSTGDAASAPRALHEEAAAKVYASSYTCQSGHGIVSATDSGSDHVLPHWPSEVHYDATGHGAYPFWLGSAGDGGSGPMEAWWSESKAAEKFYHETCYMSEAGYTGEAADSSTSTTKNQNLRGGRALLQGPPPPITDDANQVSTPCYNLMVGTLGSAKAYLYTEDEDFCCLATGQPEDLTAPQSDFMDLMTLEGKVNLTTPYYSGEAYHYVEELAPSEAVTYFFYMTTLEGYPLQQGEGGTDADTPAGTGIFIYHEYNYTTWAQPVELSDDVFAVPSVCLTTTTTCPFP